MLLLTAEKPVFAYANAQSKTSL